MAYICQDCFQKLNANGISFFKLKQYSVDDLKKIVDTSLRTEEEHQKEIDSFNSSKKIGNYIYFDDDNKKFAIPKISITGKVKDLQVYDYSSIINYELLEDGNTKEKGGIGRAVVGGALFGGVGAIVGASTGHKHKKTCSKLQIKITLNNIDRPVVYVDFIIAETKKDGIIYKNVYPLAQEAMSIFNIITDSLKQETKQNDDNKKAISPADEIMKFKQLSDAGIITQEEFEDIKKQLLNL